MHSATKLAFGILLMYVAGLLLFIAFHPGGLTLSDGNAAGNPVDVFKYMLGNRAAIGDFSQKVNISGNKVTNTQNSDPAKTGTPTATGTLHES